MKFSCMLSQWQSFPRNLCVFNTLDKFPLKVWVKCASLTTLSLLHFHLKISLPSLL